MCTKIREVEIGSFTEVCRRLKSECCIEARLGIVEIDSFIDIRGRARPSDNTSQIIIRDESCKRERIETDFRIEGIPVTC